MKVLSNRQIVISLLVSILVSGQLMAQGGPGFDRDQEQVCPHCQQVGPQGAGRGPAQMGGPRAQGRPQARGPQGPGPMHFGHILRQLDLTEEQRDLVQEIVKTNQEGVEAAHETVREAHQALQEAVANEDGEAVKAAATALAQAVQEQGLLTVAITAAVKEILTDEQLQEWEAIKAQMKEYRAHGLGRGGRRGPREPGQHQFGPQPGRGQRPRRGW